MSRLPRDIATDEKEKLVVVEYEVDDVVSIVDDQCGVQVNRDGDQVRQSGGGTAWRLKP